MSTIGLESRLVGFKKRGVALGLAAGMGWGIALIIAVVLVGMGMDLIVELPAGVRAGWGMVAIVVGIFLVARWMLLATRNVKTTSLARRLDEVAGSRGQILSGVDLSRQGNAGGQSVSRGMMEIAIQRAGDLIAGVKPGEALPGRSVRRPYLALGAILVIVGLVGVFAPPLAMTQWARFLDPFGDHPPYTKLKLIVEPGDVKILYGAGFDVKVKTDGEAVERVDVLLSTAAQDSAEEVLPMFPAGAGEWRASVSNVLGSGVYRVKAGSARSKFYKLEVITVPKLEGVRVRITQPLYANKPVYEGVVPEGGVAGLMGAKVEIFAKSNRPLSGGQMELTGDGQSAMRQAVAMSPVSGGNEAVGTFKIERNAKLALKVIDVNGQASTDSFSTQITVLPDEKPFVRLIQPMATSFATPTTPIPIEVMAEDDIGVSRVQVYRSLNDSRAMPMDIDAPKPNPTRFPVQSQLPLAEYGLKPGDVIKVFARVEDNDPAGAKGAESSVAVVRIISEEDYRKMILTREGMEVLQSKYEQARRRMEAVNEQIEKMMEQLKKESPEKELSEAEKKAMENLAKEMEQQAKEIEQAAKEDLPFDLDQHLKKELEKLAEEMKKEAQEAKKASKSQGMSVKGAMEKLQEMQKNLEGDKKDFEAKAMEPLEHLAKIYPLMEDQAKYINLYERQRDLEQRLSSLKDQENVDDPKIKARMRELEGEQAKLKENLRDLVEDIQKHAEELPDDPKLADLKKTAEDFAKGVQESEAAEQMANAEQGLSQFSGSRGHANAKDAADTLEKFLTKCQGMGEQGSACLKFSPGLAAGLGNTVQQLLDAAGLNSGNGNGTGAGGGSSASRSTLSNVGIYGRMPTRSQMARSGGGKADRGMSSDGSGRDNGDGREGGVELSGKGRTVGEADVVVPVRYKKRVGEYFQRVADEIEK